MPEQTDIPVPTDPRAALVAAKSLLAAGMPTEQVARAVGLDPAAIAAYAAKLKDMSALPPEEVVRATKRKMVDMLPRSADILDELFEGGIDDVPARVKLDAVRHLHEVTGLNEQRAGVSIAVTIAPERASELLAQIRASGAADMRTMLPLKEAEEVER